eukprot:Seg1430.8 transcript_id=Seg1430.8/GoldUCD/mRNA.D3Y31 product="Phospholipid phosphatase 6" protein_id=Seg1430.8/GoldUCD/D3Y31
MMDQLIRFDVQLSDFLSIGSMAPSLTKNVLRFSLKFLEITGHGIPWLAVTAFYAHSSTGSIQIFNANLFVALIFDLIVVGTLKFLAQRQRPSYNQDDMFATVSVDNYSFPSGHATRAMLLAILFMQFDLQQKFVFLIQIWASILALSRVVLGRHHVFDVVAGIIIGALEAWIALTYLWMDEDFITSCQSQITKYLQL